MYSAGPRFGVDHRRGLESGAHPVQVAAMAQNYGAAAKTSAREPRSQSAGSDGRLYEMVQRRNADVQSIAEGCVRVEEEPAETVGIIVS